MKNLSRKVSNDRSGFFYGFIICCACFLLSAIFAAACGRLVSSSGCERVGRYLSGCYEVFGFKAVFSAVKFPLIIFICGFFVFGSIFSPIALSAFSFSEVFMLSCMLRTAENVSFFSYLRLFVVDALFTAPCIIFLSGTVINSSRELLSCISGRGKMRSVRFCILLFFLTSIFSLIQAYIICKVLPNIL